MKIAVLGGGSWGTAIARLLSNKGHDMTFYIRNEQDVVNVNEKHENKRYLEGVNLGNLKSTTDVKEAVKDRELIVIAVPTGAVRNILNDIKEDINEEVILVNLAKGIEVDSLETVSEIAEEVLPENRFTVLSGPSHAEEVGIDIPTAVCVASKDEEAAKIVQKVFVTDKFRVYTNDDLLGVEMGGALKNIIALAAGISDGLGYGDNTKAALMTRGIYEMAKLGIKLGANSQTFNGLSGIGDLIVTCTSMHSRNRRAGILIGKGLTPEKAAEEIGQVVEGVKTTKSAYALSKKHKVSMPITDILYKILYENLDPCEGVNTLMTRVHKEEIEQIFFE